MNLTPAQEDYLKVIWRMSEQKDQVRPVQLGEYLGVKLPTVLSMLKNLSEMKLISYKRQAGIDLTKAGKNEALMVIRKHRIIETFLEKTLNLDPKLVHEEAERLEHAISDTLLMYLDRFLEFPEYDPHGREIPLSGESRPAVSLVEIDEGFTFRIISIPDDFRRAYCEEYGFIPGSIWQIEGKGPEKETVQVKNEEKHLAFTRVFAEKVKVVLNK